MNGVIIVYSNGTRNNFALNETAERNYACLYHKADDTKMIKKQYASRYE